MPDDLPDFTDKVVLIGFQGAAERSYAYLKSPAFKTHDGRLYIVGVDVTSGKFTTGVPWERVTYYTVADSMEDFHAGRKAAGKST